MIHEQIRQLEYHLAEIYDLVATIRLREDKEARIAFYTEQEDKDIPNCLWSELTEAEKDTWRERVQD